jgi:hypothetical protein
MWNSEHEMESDLIYWHQQSDDFELLRLSTKIQEGDLCRQYRLKNGKTCDVVIFSETRVTIIELKNKPLHPKDLLQLYGYIEEMEKMEYFWRKATGIEREICGVLIGTEFGYGFDAVLKTLIANLHSQLEVLKMTKVNKRLEAESMWYNYYFESHG